MQSDAFLAERGAMLEHQLRRRGVTDRRVLDAMGLIPRERFVEPHLLHRAYADAALPSRSGQTISQPLMVGLMTQLLAPEPGMAVLEIGCGTGYQAAVLAAMGCHVTGIERLGELANLARHRLAELEAELDLPGTVTVVAADGSAGLAAGAPWPRILVSAGAPRVPEALAAQLAEVGRLVVPVGPRWGQELLLVERVGAALRTTAHGGCVFVPLVGVDGWK